MILEPHRRQTHGGEPEPAARDNSLTSVLCLILFLIFAPIIGTHVFFALVADPAAKPPDARTVAQSGAARSGQR